MKSACEIILLLFSLFYLNACDGKEKICLLTVDITVETLDNDTKVLRAEAAGGLEPYTYFWEGLEQSMLQVERNIGQGAGTYNVYVEDAAGCEVTDSVVVTFPPQELKKMTINKVKVTYFSPTRGGSDWDNDGTPPDLRLSISKGSSQSTTAGFYSTQLFDNQASAPVTFETDFPFVISEVDSLWNVALWDDDPGAPETMGAIQLAPKTKYQSGDVDTTILQSGSASFPKFTVYMTWGF